MAKKRTKKVTPKKVETPETDLSTISLEIPTSEPTVCFKLGDETIEDTVAEFHRLGVQAQSEAFNDRGEIENYMPEYAKLLNNHFQIDFVITEAVAYRIFDASFNLFHQLKKS